MGKYCCRIELAMRTPRAIHSKHWKWNTWPGEACIASRGPKSRSNKREGIQFGRCPRSLMCVLARARGPVNARELATLLKGGS